MRTRALPVFVVVTALVAVGTAGAVMTVDSTAANPAATNATTTQHGGDRTVSVSGEGSASAAPDTAVVTVAVVVDGDDPAAIRDDLASGAQSLRTALTDAGIDADQISTTDYQIREPRRYDRAESGPDYTGTHAFEVRLDDTDRTGTVVDATAENSAEVTGVEFTLAEETRTDLRDEALENAMGDARGQAETLAAAGDLQVTGVATVDASNRNYSPVRYEAAMADSAGSSGTTIDAGDVTVSVDVRVTYNATETGD